MAAQQNGQTPKVEWPSTTISFVGDEEMACWLDELSEKLYGPKGRSQLMRRIVKRYRRMVLRNKPELAKSSLQKQAIVEQEGGC